MIISIQIENLNSLKEVLNSECDRVRFGSEFCEFKIPSLNLLKKAYKLITDRGKEFAYITPKLSNISIRKVKQHLDFLNENGPINIIFNDLGLLQLLQKYPNLKPHMGRQLVYIPARCPWPEITVGGSISRWMARRRVEKIFYQTSLNHELTIQFFRNYKVENVDLDWIPKCFPHYDYIVRNGFNLSLHLYLIPVTLTRKCHMARLLGEKEPEKCSRPCETYGFVLKRKDLGIELFLWGNVVFKMIEPAEKELKEAFKIKISEFVIPLNPLTKIKNEKEINNIIQLIRSSKSKK